MESKRTEDFTHSFMKRVAELREMSGDKEHADKIRKDIAIREEIEYKALEIVDDYSAELIGALIFNRASSDPRMAFITEMGWMMDGFNGTAQFFCSLASAAVSKKDYSKALILRVFSIATEHFGVQHVENEEVAELVRDMYDMPVSMPTQEEWDQASATLAFQEADTEFTWNETMGQTEEEEDDDELD